MRALRDNNERIKDQDMHPDIKLNLFGGHNLRVDEAERAIFIYILYFIFYNLYFIIYILVYRL